jgi:hypothetical protein
MGVSLRSLGDASHPRVAFARYILALVPQCPQDLKCASSNHSRAMIDDPADLELLLKWKHWFEDGTWQGASGEWISDARPNNINNCWIKGYQRGAFVLDPTSARVPRDPYWVQSLIEEPNYHLEASKAHNDGHAAYGHPRPSNEYFRATADQNMDRMREAYRVFTSGALQAVARREYDAWQAIRDQAIIGNLYVSHIDVGHLRFVTVGRRPVQDKLIVGNNPGPSRYTYRNVVSTPVLAPASSLQPRFSVPEHLTIQWPGAAPNQFLVGVPTPQGIAVFTVPEGSTVRYPAPFLTGPPPPVNHLPLTSTAPYAAESLINLHASPGFLIGLPTVPVPLAYIAPQGAAVYKGPNATSAQVQTQASSLGLLENRMLKWTAPLGLSGAAACGSKLGDGIISSNKKKRAASKYIRGPNCSYTDKMRAWLVEQWLQYLARISKADKTKLNRTRQARFADRKKIREDGEARNMSRFILEHFKAKFPDADLVVKSMPDETPCLRGGRVNALRMHFYNWKMLKGPWAREEFRCPLQYRSPNPVNSAYWANATDTTSSQSSSPSLHKSSISDRMEVDAKNGEEEFPGNDEIIGGNTQLEDASGGSDVDREDDMNGDGIADFPDNVDGDGKDDEFNGIPIPTHRSKSNI